VAEKPIRFEFVAEVAQYLRDTKKVAVSTEDIADALLSVTNSSEDLERKLSRAMREVDKDVDTLQRSIRDLPKATKAAADAADKDFGKIGDDARDAGREVGDEFRQNLGESLSSGSMEDLVSDTLGGIVGSMKGPLGLAAAGVAGVGALIFNQLKKDWETTATALKNTAQGLVDMQIEVGRQLLYNTERQQVMSDLVKQDPEFWAKTREVAEQLGLTLQDVGDAILGGQDAMDALKGKLQQTVEEGKILNTSAEQYGPKLTPGAAKAAELLGYLQKSGAAASEAEAQFLNMQSVLGISAANSRALQENLRLARDYAAGIGGRAPLVGAGQVAKF
jgi:uncharacterized protein with PIN domain